MTDTVSKNIMENIEVVYKSIVTKVCDRLSYDFLPYFSYTINQWSYGGDWYTLNINLRHTYKYRSNRSSELLTTVCSVTVGDSPLSEQNIDYKAYETIILSAFVSSKKISMKCELKKKETLRSVLKIVNIVKNGYLL